MTQDELWLQKYQEVVAFIDRNRRNPSRYEGYERGKRNWIKHQRKLLNAGTLKEERVEKFRELMELCEQYKHVNQYV